MLMQCRLLFIHLASHLGDALSFTVSNRELDMDKHLNVEQSRGGERANHRFGSVYLGRSISTRFGWIGAAAGAVYNLFSL